MTTARRRGSIATSGVTSPKGRPTPQRDASPQQRDTVTLQWVGVGVAVVAIIGVLFWVGSDWGGQPTHGGGGHGAPADAPAVVDGTVSTGSSSTLTSGR